MPKIYVKFRSHDPLILYIQDDPVGNQLTDLIKKNYMTARPVYRDRIKYNEDYMIELIEKAKNAFGWECNIPSYQTEFSIYLHKDLERLLGTTGFQDIPAQHDELLMELHYCLHIIQHPKSVNTRNGAFQIEWFNDTGFVLPDGFEFQNEKQFGDIELLNPWVGHGPAQIFFENDHINIPMTCMFHDYVIRGLVLSTFNQKIDKNKVLYFFQMYAPEFVQKHTADKILHYTGYPKIGYIENLDVFEKLLISTEVIELERLTFDEST